MVYLITSGAMEEKIDDVRSIFNTSSGKTGATIADYLAVNHQVVYVHTKSAIKPNNQQIETKLIDSVSMLDETLKAYLTQYENITVIHAMAVSDFHFGGQINIDQLVSEILDNKNNLTKTSLNKIIDNNTLKTNKLSSKSDVLFQMKRNPKVISNIKIYNPKAKLVGFKLLSNVTNEELFKVALEQKLKNNCDIVIANKLEDLKNEHIAYVISGENNKIKCLNNKEIAQTISQILGR